ncbi:glycosyl hydrolase family 28-related protein [Enterococcus termitis]|uniref:Uncharacterized protein n=1 Tax=Enterococcus termitis TaxID=332950 RepID=A0A1E5GAT5_9ENTE|nr:glycosyl hydrolase family 28-related protein [Enterococcus termitis]OEG09814.1 hypothetical protein BCR25_09920 [Enterococcus termitis]
MKKIQSKLIHMMMVAITAGLSTSPFINAMAEEVKEPSQMEALVKEPKSIPANSLDATDQTIFGANALVPDAEENQANQLLAAMNKAISLGKYLYIPKGTYYIEYTRVFPSNSVMIGDEEGATIFKNRTTNDINLGSANQYGNRSVLTFKNLFFDGLSINTDMFKNVTLDSCVFYNPVSNFQVFLEFSENATIKNNIFLRDVDHAKGQDSPVGGAAWNHTIYLGGYTTAKDKLNQYQYNTLVENNLIGAKIDELDALKYVQKNADGLANTITRLQHALEDEQSIVLERNEQNIISTGINSFSTLKKARILNNIFYSNKDNEETNGFITQDHVTYLRGSTDVVLAGNHVRGWFNGSWGGFKFKSGREISIMNNYFRNTGLIMTDDPEIGVVETTDRVSMYKDIFVANNTFDFKYWDGGYRIGMEFSAQQAPDKTSISNGVFINNRYIHFSNTKKADLLLYNPTTKTGFHPTNNSHVSGNTRDDGAHNGFSIVYGWTAEDYEKMNPDWESIYKPSGYNEYVALPIPEKNMLPSAVPTTIKLGDEVQASDLVKNTFDKDEATPVARIMNPNELESVGIHRINVELTYPTGFMCVIRVPVTVEGSSEETTEITANPFTVKLSEVSHLTAEQVIEKAQAKAISMPSNEEQELTVNYSELKEATEAGVYKVIFESNGVQKEIDITVEEDEQPEETIEITAEPFTIRLSEIQELTDARVIELAQAKAVLIPSNIEQTLTVDYSTLKEATEAGIYTIVFEANGHQKEIEITVEADDAQIEETTEINAYPFTVKLSELKNLTADQIIEKAQATAILSPSGERQELRVDYLSLQAATEAGIYKVIFESNGVQKEIDVTVELDEEQPEGITEITAEPFTIKLSEIESLTETMVIEKAKAVSMLNGENQEITVDLRSLKEATTTGVYTIILISNGVQKEVEVTVEADIEQPVEITEITAEPFTIKLSEVNALTETQIIEKAQAKAVLIPSGKEQALTVKYSSLLEAARAGSYKIVFESNGVQKEIEVIVEDDIEQIEETTEISAESFTIRLSEVNTLTAKQIIEKAKAKAILTPSGKEQELALEYTELKAAKQIGVYKVTFKSNDVQKQVEVIVEANEELQKEITQITAEPFTVKLSEVKSLTENQVIEKARAKAVLLPSREEQVLSVKYSALREATEVGNYKVTFTSNDVQKEIEVKVVSEDVDIQDTVLGGRNVRVPETSQQEKLHSDTAKKLPETGENNKKYVLVEYMYIVTLLYIGFRFLYIKVVNGNQFSKREK